MSQWGGGDADAGGAVFYTGGRGGSYACVWKSDVGVWRECFADVGKGCHDGRKADVVFHESCYAHVRRSYLDVRNSDNDIPWLSCSSSACAAILGVCFAVRVVTEMVEDIM